MKQYWKTFLEGKSPSVFSEKKCVINNIVRKCVKIWILSNILAPIFIRHHAIYDEEEIIWLWIKNFQNMTLVILLNRDILHEGKKGNSSHP